MKRFALPLALALALTSPAAATAATETEPNEGIHQWNGPLAANTPYDGTLSTYEDQDWYAFYVSGGGTVNVKFTNPDDDLGCCPNVALTDDTGEHLNATSAYEGESETIQYTTPGPGKYYIVVYSPADPGDRYSLTVTGPLTSGPPAESAQPTPNNNPEMNSAFGPLTGDVLYGGRLDTYNEEDWFYFYVRSRGSFLLELTNIRDGTGCCPNLALHDEDGTHLNEVSAYEDQIARITYTAGKPGKYYAQVHSPADAGDSYQLKVRPGWLLSPTPPPPSEACATATADVKKFKRKVKRTKRKVKGLKAKKRNASGNRKRKLGRKLRKQKSKLKKQKGKLRGAKEQKEAAC